MCLMILFYENNLGAGVVTSLLKRVVKKQQSNIASASSLIIDVFLGTKFHVTFYKSQDVSQTY
jgi:hypothetical protein